MFNATVTAKFLTHAKIKYIIVANTFFNVCEKIHQVLSSIKKMHTKESWFHFFCLMV